MQYIPAGIISATVFITKYLALSLYPDNVIDELKDKLEESDYKNLCYSRQIAINTLHHKFAHVYQKKLLMNIDWANDFEEKKLSFYDQYISLCLTIWDEYFTCRISCNSKQLKFDDIEELVSTSINIEKKLKEQRKLYHTHQIKLDEFVSEFHKLTNMVLKKIAYLHGQLHVYSNEKRHE